MHANEQKAEKCYSAEIFTAFQHFTSFCPPFKAPLTLQDIKCGDTRYQVIFLLYQSATTSSLPSVQSLLSIGRIPADPSALQVSYYQHSPICSVTASLYAGVTGLNVRLDSMSCSIKGMQTDRKWQSVTVL